MNHCRALMMKTSKMNGYFGIDVERQRSPSKKLPSAEMQYI